MSFVPDGLGTVLGPNIKLTLTCIETILTCIETALTCVELTLTCIETTLTCFELTLTCIETALYRNGRTPHPFFGPTCTEATALFLSTSRTDIFSYVN